MASVYEVITARIIEQLQSGTAPWHKPWKARGKNGLPRNLITGHEYRRINIWILLSAGYASPFWLTFRQARGLGGHVRKGEAGLPVVYWKFGTREVQDGDEIIEKPSVVCRYFTVFNTSSAKGSELSPFHLPTVNPRWNPSRHASRLSLGGPGNRSSSMEGTAPATTSSWM
jgi:antirestriction protein ArdC